MVFSSISFLCVFLPITYLINLICPSIKIKNFVLTIFSLIFYAFGEPKAIFLMLFSIVFNYIIGLLISKNKNRLILCIGIIVNLLILCIFKYLNFIIDTIGDIFSLSFSNYNSIALPIGISFFTFQAMSYIIDVYRDTTLVQKNILNLMLYISFFPQLIAGPIIKYSDMEYQINNRNISVDNTVLGIRRFIFGLTKKLLISNAMGLVADTIFDLDTSYINLISSWIAGITYTLQIYFDFSGYSDMAIGIGKIFGFEFKENFNYPYTAISVQDFWRKWHISLSTWFKEYLYIPLGGNRKGSIRTVLNKVFVFFCTGLWHGANFTFIIWGLVHGLLLLLEYYKIIPIDECKFKPLKHLYTLLCVIITFVMFRAENVSQGILFIKNMFIGYDFTLQSLSPVLILITPSFILTLILAIVFSIPIERVISNKITKTYSKEIFSVVQYWLSFILICLCIITLSKTGYNPFIYFQF